MRHRRLSLSDELAVALHTIEDFGRSIQSADAKAGALAAVLGLVVGGLISEITSSARVLTRSHLTGAPGVAFGMVLTTLVVAGVSLGLTQLPRLTAPAETGRLAFPEVARAVQAVRSASGLPDEAWCQARVLATIAFRKFRYLRIALPATGACVVAFLCWLVLAALATP